LLSSGSGGTSCIHIASSHQDLVGGTRDRLLIDPSDPIRCLTLFVLLDKSVFDRAALRSIHSRDGASRSRIIS